MSSDRVKKFHKVAFWLWVIPGLPISFFLRNSVMWVMILSVYTILVEHLLGWRDEKKREGGSDDR